MKNTIENAQRFFQEQEVYGVDQWSNKEIDHARIMFEYANSLVKESDSLPCVKSFTYKDVSKVAEELANDYSSDKKDPVWIDIRQDGIKAIQAFISKHVKYFTL